MKFPALPPKRNLALMVASAFIATGCAVKPVAIPDESHIKRTVEDQRRLFDEQEPVSAPLTLADALARALRYNMDVRVKLMEEASALGQTDLANYELLPKLTAAAGYSWRNNDSFGYGYTPGGTISTTPSAASERGRSFDSLTFSWNVLDFGLSYLRAKQMADQALIAEERRRKAVQNLVLDVRNAWWRAEAAQRLLPEIDALIGEVDQAAARAKLIETHKLLPPLQIVAYKRSLLDLEQQISLRRQELVQAKLELAQLINLRPGQDFSIALPKFNDPTPPDLTANVAALEQLALHNRPELREEGYRARITELEGNKQWLSLLPSLSFDVGVNHDSNKYLVNNRWTSAGVNLSWNLLKLTSASSIRQTNEAAAKVDETRRLAQTAAVLGQTRIAAVRYHLLTQELAIWNDAVADDQRIVGYLAASQQVGLETELELIRAKARAMVSRINRDLVFANVQGAVGRLYNSMGIDTVPLEVESRSPEILASALGESIRQWEARHFAPKPSKQAITVKILPPAGSPNRDEAEHFITALARILKMSKVAVADGNEASTYRVVSDLTLQAKGTSGQPAVMKLKVLNEAGQVVFEAEQNSMLMTPVTPEQWQALGEGAAYRLATPLRGKLMKPGNPNLSQIALPTPPAIAPEQVPTAAQLDQTTTARKTETAGAIADAVQRGNSTKE